MLSTNIPNLIQSQTQLLSLSLEYISITPFKYCSNTLTSIKFIHCNFANILLFDGFESFTQLKSLQFILCRGLTTQLFQSLLNIPVPLKIQSLKVVIDVLSISRIDLLLQKIGSYLENLDLRIYKDTEREIALKSIGNYCDRIKFLHLSWINDNNIPQFYKLITHLNKHLKYLSLQQKFSFPHENDLKIGSMILKGLGQILPGTLEYLNLHLLINPNDLRFFLDNCNHVVRLNKLLVKNCDMKNIDITFNILKEFVREKKIKNFAYRIGRNLFDPEKYQNLRKLVNEFQSFVKMKKYDDLILNPFDI